MECCTIKIILNEQTEISIIPFLQNASRTNCERSQKGGEKGSRRLDILVFIFSSRRVLQLLSNNLVVLFLNKFIYDPIKQSFKMYIYMKETPPP